MRDPLQRVVYLWKNKENRENKISLLFYLCLEIIIVVDFVFGYFYYFNNKIMFIINIVCLLVNFFIYFLLEKNKRRIALTILLTELYVYLVCATLMMGWNYGFQQYIFGMLCIFFLTFYLPDVTPKRIRISLLVGVLFVITYFALGYICNNVDMFKGLENISSFTSKIYGLNSFVSMSAVGSFCYLSSIINAEDNKKLKRKADYDSLTQIYNRYGLNQIIDQMVSCSKVNSFYLSIADIDFFKKINDTYGHNVGDEVLKRVAVKLKELTKKGIQVGRWGGEEFLIVSTIQMTKKEFKVALESIREYFDTKTLHIDTDNINLTLSFGVAKYEPGLTSDCVIKEADINLYKAKQTGRNKIVD